MIRKTVYWFPDVKDEEIHCGMVSGSTSMDRCTIVLVRRVINPKKRISKTWTQITCTEENRLGPHYYY